MIYLSSDQIYNGKKRSYKEDDEISPINIYGITKFLGESFIRSNLKKFLIIRTNFLDLELNQEGLYQILL